MVLYNKEQNYKQKFTFVMPRSKFPLLVLGRGGGGGGGGWCRAATMPNLLTEQQRAVVQV